MKRSDILKRIGITPPPASRIRLIVDTDAKNEADDQFAIMHHLLTPMFDVCGIIATHFEQKTGHTGTSMEASYREIEKVLTLAEIEDVPFFRGCVSPLRSPGDTPESEGTAFLISQARQPGKLYIAVQGAMTNVAAA
ncbi:MAG: nucleoside hydrolase, partial [Clostridia bacterium]|nr:nucleoside hydrolase [Clostridia bacterium]